MFIEDSKPQRYHLHSHLEAIRRSVWSASLQASAEIGPFRTNVALTSSPPGLYPDPPTSDWTLHMIIQGRGRMRVDFGAGSRITEIRPGSFTLVPAATACDFEVETAFICVGIGLSQTALDDWSAGDSKEHSRFLEMLCRETFYDDLMEVNLRRLTQVLAERTPWFALYQDVLLQATIQSLFYKASGCQGVFKSRVFPLRADDLTKIRNFVRDHLRTRIFIHDLAAVVGLPATHFQRSFRVTVGKSALEFVRQQRLERALEMLRSGRYSLAWIASETGFADQAHLCRTVKAATGWSPDRLRRNYRLKRS